jgi:hypothetical protein
MTVNPVTFSVAVCIRDIPNAGGIDAVITNGCAVRIPVLKTETAKVWLREPLDTVTLLGTVTAGGAPAGGATDRLTVVSAGGG